MNSFSGAFKIFCFSLIAGVVFLGSCGKDKESPYKLTMSGTGELLFDWSSEKIDGLVVNDTLLIAASRKDKSKVALVLVNSSVGDYEISAESIQALVTFDLVGDNKPENKFLSTEGVVSVIENDSKNNVITGFFSVKAVSGALEEVTVEGNFVSKYQD